MPNVSGTTNFNRTRLYVSDSNGGNNNAPPPGIRLLRKSQPRKGLGYYFLCCRYDSQILISQPKQLMQQQPCRSGKQLLQQAERKQKNGFISEERDSYGVRSSVPYYLLPRSPSTFYLTFYLKALFHLREYLQYQRKSPPHCPTVQTSYNFA